jgi:hypothetical protein
MSARWWASWPEPLAAYAMLMRLAADGRISGVEFDLLFGQHYEDDNTDWPIAVLDVLEQVYFDLKDFRSARTGLGQPRGLSEAELRSRATVAFERLAAVDLTRAYSSVQGPVAVAL